MCGENSFFFLKNIGLVWDCFSYIALPQQVVLLALLCFFFNKIKKFELCFCKALKVLLQGSTPQVLLKNNQTVIIRKALLTLFIKRC